MKDILPGMTVHLTVGNYTDTTITVNGHKMTIRASMKLGSKLYDCWMRILRTKRFAC